jgi:response regulator RpfG family c-di-GMP phosphodiesterase
MLDPNARFDLSKANVLIMDTSLYALDILSQMLRGFGVGSIVRASSIDEGEKFVRAKTFDLIIVDPTIADGRGYAFVHELRHSETRNCHAPVLLATGYPRVSDVWKGRDEGANFIVAKPLSPTVLLQRIQWIACDPRPFVETAEYIGPDRRFKFEGPPEGGDGRRASDLTTPLGDAREPNMSQDEVSAMIKPQKVTL